MISLGNARIKGMWSLKSSSSIMALRWPSFTLKLTSSSLNFSRKGSSEWRETWGSASCWGWSGFPRSFFFTHERQVQSRRQTGHIHSKNDEAPAPTSFDLLVAWKVVGDALLAEHGLALLLAPHFVLAAELDLAVQVLAEVARRVRVVLHALAQLAEVYLLVPSVGLLLLLLLLLVGAQLLLAPRMHA